MSEKTPQPLTINKDPIDGLTHSQERFVECLVSGMTVRAASAQLGIAVRQGIALSHHQSVREAVAARRKELRNKFMLSREDCVKGFLKAIDDAKLVSDPMAQISGWREIGKMLGHYEPERKVVELSDKREEALQQLQDLGVEELMSLAGDSAIDGEFFVVDDEDASVVSH
jgi:hypothetical protein